MRVYFTNLGCKLNQAELERLAREFHFAGHEVVSSLEQAELHVVNSCTVTHRAARDSRKIARRGARRRPGLRTVLTGCYATGSPEEAARLAGVDLVVPNRRKDELLALVHEAFPDALPEALRAGGRGGPGTLRAEPPEPSESIPFVPLAFGNTRTLVKVEDGCNMRCAFCIIPSTRGRQRSRPIPEIVAEVRSMARQGFREVVVTGVQISHYRWRGRTLHDLAVALLERTDVARIRLTSLAPWAFDRRLLGLLGHPRVCRHVHMSLQSGCDATLGRMRRPYSTAAYAALVEEIREAVPGVAVTTDVIVGFPGESEAEDEASRAFVERMGFARTHVFPFSARAGTEAAELPGRLAPEIVKERTAAMLEAAAEGARRFRAAQAGATVPVLWEDERDGRLLGTSDNYLRVAAPRPAEGGPRALAGEITAARILAASDRSGRSGSGDVIGRVLVGAASWPAAAAAR
jgi:threonylcarbamoyladenosine tRNA methylthiotransferase MtaB